MLLIRFEPLTYLIEYVALHKTILHSDGQPALPWHGVLHGVLATHNTLPAMLLQ